METPLAYGFPGGRDKGVGEGVINPQGLLLPAFSICISVGAMKKDRVLGSVSFQHLRSLNLDKVTDTAM